MNQATIAVDALGRTEPAPVLPLCELRKCFGTTVEIAFVAQSKPPKKRCDGGVAEETLPNPGMTLFEEISKGVSVRRATKFGDDQRLIEFLSERGSVPDQSQATRDPMAPVGVIRVGGEHIQLGQGGDRRVDLCVAEHPVSVTMWS